VIPVPGPSDPLSGVYRRIERAQLNYQRFDTEYRKYIRSKPAPYRCVVEIDPHRYLWGYNGRVVFKLDKPLDFGLIVSDIITDLRFALDYLVYDLAVASTRQDPPPDWRGLEFPVNVTRAGFKQRKNGKLVYNTGLRKIDNLNPRVKAAIQHVQSYKAIFKGKLPEMEGLFHLHEMCNLYKHRILAPVVLQVDGGSLILAANDCLPTHLKTDSAPKRLSNDAVLATFVVPDMLPSSKVQLKTQPAFGIGSRRVPPPGIPPSTTS
jgi:hypothetical protein